jgi:hypothetical protein
MAEKSALISIFFPENFVVFAYLSVIDESLKSCLLFNKLDFELLVDCNTCWRLDYGRRGLILLL